MVADDVDGVSVEGAPVSVPPAADELALVKSVGDGLGSTAGGSPGGGGGGGDAALGVASVLDPLVTPCCSTCLGGTGGGGGRPAAFGAFAAGASNASGVHRRH